MISFITSLWDRNYSSGTTLTHACKEHIAEKNKELKNLEAEIEKEKKHLSEKIQKMTESYKVHENAKYETKLWLEGTLRSLRSVEEAIQESVRSSDVDAIEQTVLLMHSVSIEDFRDAAKQLREKEEASGKIMDEHRVKREKQHDIVCQLEESRKNLIAHINEIEHIQQQLNKSSTIATTPKRHSD